MDEIEARYGREKGYKELLPFLSDKHRKKYVPLLMTHIITGMKDPI